MFKEIILLGIGAILGPLLVVFYQYVPALWDRFMYRKEKTYGCAEHDCYEIKCWEKSETEKSGSLHHSFGEPFKDGNKDIWQYPRKTKPINGKKPKDALEPNDKKGMHVIYGPYVNDFNRSGWYKVLFYMRVKGLTDSEPNKKLLKIEVVKVLYTPHYSNNSGNYMGKNYHQIPIAVKIISRKDFRCYDSFRLYRNDSYSPLALDFFIQGEGEYEYRVFVFEENLKDGESLFFDSVKIHPVRYM